MSTIRELIESEAIGGIAEEERARRLIEQALRKWGWTAQDLKARQKGDAFKVRLAAKL